jgi:lipoate-protein ligase A
MEYLESDSTDPRWNLALEQYVFEQMDRSGEYFILWRNANTIVVGKNQNTVQEINNDYVRRHGITVVRRLSGGGAVYHDLGNLNYTFIADGERMEKLDFQLFCQPVVQTLRSFGVHAEISGRNDITVDGKKFSGNSQYLRQGRVMHHGTILFNSDLSVVEKALHTDESKIASKGITSIRSRVTNLSEYLTPDVTLDCFKARLLAYVTEQKGLRPAHLTPEDRQKIAAIERGRYDTWEWNYGRSPDYTDRCVRRIEGCGQVEVSLLVEAGIIRDIQFFGDFFGSGDTAELAQQLKDCPRRREEIERRLANCNPQWYIHNLTARALAELIAP